MNVYRSYLKRWNHRKSSGYECVIGVSGGKDSYFQVHFVKEKLGLNPLQLLTMAIIILMLAGTI